MRAKKILLLGTHGQYNIGDELLLETFLSQLGDQHEYIVNTYDPEFTTRQLGDQFNLKVFHTTQDRLRMLALILQSDLVIFGGGSVLKELYASVGRNRYTTLLMVLAIVGYAKFVGRKPVFMCNIGIGPVETKVGHLLTWLILSLVDYASLRDRKSYETCLKLKIKTDKVAFVPDPVFVHKPAFFIGEQENLRGQSVPLKVALNLNYNIEHPEYWDAFIQNLAEGLRKVHRQRPLQIHALPMQSGFKDHHDLGLLMDFRALIPEIEMVLHNPVTTRDMGDIIANCDLVVAERLHSCISAAVLGTPFLPLIYDVKVRETVKILGMAEFGLEIDDSFNADRFSTALSKLIAQNGAVSEHLRVHTAALHAQLRGYFRVLNSEIAAIPI